MHGLDLTAVMAIHDAFVAKFSDDFNSENAVSKRYMEEMKKIATTPALENMHIGLEAALEARQYSIDEGEEFEHSDEDLMKMSDEVVAVFEKMCAVASIDDEGNPYDEEADIITMPTPTGLSIKREMEPAFDATLSLATEGQFKTTGDLITHVRKGEEALAEVVELRSRMSEMGKPSAVPTFNLEASDDIPEGKMVQRIASDVFDIRRGKKAFDFEIPFFEWEEPHPHVPAIDEGYIFRPMPLLNLLLSLVNNDKAYLVGHTGTGKTTLVEQILARMNYPMIRVNFDSEITRMDLIGRDVLVNEEGNTVSKFVDGVLPTALSGPYGLGCDEIDRIRAEVSYVFHRMLENNGLLLTEDGGRLVRPHPMHRLVANANTVGQGDDYGMYQGARPQSQAFLDRFTKWINVDYLKPKDEKKLLLNSCPALPEKYADSIIRYAKEHREAFVNAEVLQPLSPRGVVALGETLVHFLTLLPDESKASSEALETVVLNRASPQDRAVLKGLVNRVWVAPDKEEASE